MYKFDVQLNKREQWDSAWNLHLKSKVGGFAYAKMTKFNSIIKFTSIQVSIISFVLDPSYILQHGVYLILTFSRAVNLLDFFY